MTGPGAGERQGSPSVDPAAVEALVRAYVARVARRYAPLAVGLAFLLIVVTLVPSRSPQSSGGGLQGFAGSGSGSPSASGPAGGGGPSPASPGNGPVAGGAGPVGGGAAGAPTSPGITPPAAPGSAGAARSGVPCGGGARQVTWSHYAPVCEPAYHGNNGGATGPGVTGDTITISYRLANSTQQSAVNAYAQGAVPVDSTYTQDLGTYLKLFNRDFELYGRHVVLKTYQGQGDYLQEDEGQGLSQTQADAATVRQMGGFADDTFPVTSSQPYEEDLASERVISLSGVGLPLSWYQRFSPYEYAYSPDGTKYADWEADLVCQRLAGLPAVYAGDPVYQHENRVFGLISPENPVYVEDANNVRNGLRGCGVNVARSATYSINVTQFETQSTSIVAQMKAANVTTLLCICDPLMPEFLTQSADQQSWRPEWNTPNFFDPDSRLMQSDQWSHDLAFGGGARPKAQTEAYQAFKLANPGGEPAEQYYFIAYYSLLQLFDAVQAAGPQLNAAAFQRGMFSLPPSLPGGDAGDWRFGNGVFSPETDIDVGWWDPNAVSNMDGKKGAMQSCEGAKLFPYDNPAAWGPAHTQLHCYNR